MNKIIIILIILLSLAGDVFLGIKYYYSEVELQKVSSVDKINENVLTFNKLFVDKVLNAQGEISQEDKLKLENAAVATKDSTIINAWHDLLGSTTQEDAQNRVLNLLGLFPEKIIY